MMLKTASLAILGTAAMAISVLASPALAEGTMTKNTRARMPTYAQAETRAPQTLGPSERYGQRQVTYSRQIRSANAALPDERVYRRRAGPGEVAANVVGGAVATAGAIATAPFRAAEGGYYNGSYGYGYDNGYYSNYYGYGYGGRDWKTYATRNSLACTPGTMIKGADGRQHLCQ